MKKNPRILIFSTAYYPFVAGAEVAIKGITDRLGGSFSFNKEIQVLDWDMITLRLKYNLPKKEKIGNVNIYRIGFGLPILDKFLAPFWGVFLAIFLHQKNNYKHFWVVMVSFVGLSAYFAKIVCFWKKISIILTLQEGDSEEYFKKKWFGLIDFFWYFTLKRTDILTAISVYLSERAKRFGYKKEIYIVPNGVDTSLFKNNFKQEELLYTKRDLGFSDGDKIIFSSSRLVEKNGLEFLILSLKYLPEYFKLLIAGDGPLHKYLLEKAKNIGVENRVKLLGFVPQKNISRLLALSFAFVRPSISEGFGNSFIEAMSVGVPVLATKVGGIKDFLIDKENGIFVEIKSGESIAFNILKLEKDFVLMNKIIEGGKKTAEQYSFDQVVLKMKDIFLSI